MQLRTQDTVVVFIACVAGHAAAQCGPLFPDVVYNDNFGQPTDIAFGDVNGDGAPDMIVCDAEFGAGVRFGTGDGNFGPQTDYAMGGGPNAISLGDLDGDGTLDIAVAGFGIDEGCDPYYDPDCCDPYYDPYCYYRRGGGGGPAYIDNGVFYRLNNGDGTFGAINELSTMFDPRDLNLADFDGDGDLDITCVEFDSFLSTKVWFNDGTGFFGPPDEYSTNIGGTGVAAGDMNGDGNVDIVIARSFSHVAEVLLNTGSGSFAAPVSYTLLGIRPEGIALGDADGDGDLDVAITVDSPPRVNVLTNDGTGVLGTIQSLNSTGSPDGVEFADTDNDGDNDLLVAFGGAVRVHKNDGAGMFTEDDIVLVAGVSNIDVADVNDDGLVDVGMVSTTFTSAFSVRLNTPEGLAARQDDYNPVSDPNKLSLFDFDNDGDQDIAVGRISSQFPNLAVMVNAGDGTYPTQIDLFTETTPFPATGDVNGDGFSDIVTANLSGNSMSVFLNNTVGGFDAPVTTEYGGLPRASVLADLDGDGDLDHLTQLSSDDLVVIMLNDGMGAFTTRIDISVPDSPSQIDVGDIDADGDIDLLVTRRSADAVAVLLNNGDATFAPAVSYEVGEDPNSIDLDDIDGDGDLDFATHNIILSNTNGVNPDTLSVRFNDGSGVFSGSQDIEAGFGIEHVRAGDVDGDGDIDLISSNRDQFAFTVLVNTDGSGTSWESTQFIESRGVRWTEIADIDQDGNPDVITAAASGFVSVNFGYSCAATCVADLAAPDGVLNFFDVAAFISLYNADDPGADLAAPLGVLNFFDVAAYIAAYNAGCP